MRAWLASALVLLAAAVVLAQPKNSPGADDADRRRVGRTADGRIVVPTNQVLSPLGTQIEFPGRPTDVALSPDGRWLAVLNLSNILLIDLEKQVIVDRPRHAGGSFTGIRFAPDGRRLFASTFPRRNRPANDTLLEFDVNPAGKLKPLPPVPLPGRDPVPAGLALTADSRYLLVALNLANALAVIDRQDRKVRHEVPVGVAPYGVALARGKAYVTNWGGPRPTPADVSGPTGTGGAVKVDPRRHIAAAGSVSVVDWPTGKPVQEIAVGLHPSGIAAAPDERFVYVANANSDTISVIDTQADRLVETIAVRPAKELLFGSAPNALAVSADGTRLYVANGGNNAIAIVALAPPHSRLLGCLPTGWYPGGLVLDPRRKSLYVANVKGIGSRDTGWQGKRAIAGRPVAGFNSHDHRGTVSLILLPDETELAAQTRTVLANNRMTESISALAPPRPQAPPRPVPARHGEPSPLRHVLYIIKENRTYDQVFGDVAKGEGDPSLCLFGQEVTPNHHKLADEFVLFDNFYCSGVLSADGHQWTDEALVTDYIEKSFGGWPRSYPYDGGDALAYAPTGFLWDNVLAHGKTVRVYGEFVTATVRWKDPQRTGSPGYLDCLTNYLLQTQQIEIRPKATIKTIEPFLCPTYIGFPGTVPDQYRASEFIKELRGFKRQGRLPSFSILLLPGDHTMGTRPGAPTPATAVADNDLALGRIVAAVSHSPFWKDTCIFVVQDDPQNGFDHIDGHRTVALVISPYTRRGFVDHTNYNQTSMVRTLELILGLPPMNQFDSSATPMTTCFTDQPDFTPYQAVKNRIPLDRLNPRLAAIRNARQLYWALRSLALDLDEVDEADEDTLNRILWFAGRGRDDTYPAWAVRADSKDDD